jgi:small-conductance mechanosensitive channel
VLAARTETDIDDLVVDLLAQTRVFFLLAMGVLAGSYVLELPEVTGRLIERIVILLALLQTGIWGSGVIGYWIGRTMKKRLQEDAAGATTLAGVRFVAKFVLYAILLLLALDNLGIDITALVAGLGVGGIAVALAVQSVLGDLFASLSIVLDKPFVIGDFIIVDQLMGTVEHIGLKTTRIRSLSGEQIIFSNADLLRSRIRNYKRMFERRVVFTIGVTYQTPHEKLVALPAVLRKMIEAHPEARFDRSHFKEYGDSALVFESVYYVKSPDYNMYMDVQQAINLEIHEYFTREGIEFAYPTRTLFVQGVGTPSPGAVDTPSDDRAPS